MAAHSKTLIADIGGTHARFALLGDAGEIADIKVVRCADYPSLADALEQYLGEKHVSISHVRLAVAGLADDAQDQQSFPNLAAWNFSKSNLKTALGLESLKIMNDFTAIALAMPHLAASDYRQIGGGDVKQGQNIGIIGPGTGLGVAGIVFVDGKPQVITSEGGNITMCASNTREDRLFGWLREHLGGHLSAEQVVSGIGIVNLYKAVLHVDGQRDMPMRSAAEIASLAIAGKSNICAEVLETFCRCLGVLAGNLALTYGAFGGIYIAGGIIPQLGDYFDRSDFRAGFEAKADYRTYVSGIATRLVTHPYPGLLGLAKS